MTTAKELVLQRSLLPQVGTYTMKEHFASLTASVTATLGGTISISTKTYPITLSSKPSSLVVSHDTISSTITPKVQDISISDVKEVNIVIDTCS